MMFKQEDNSEKKMKWEDKAQCTTGGIRTNSGFFKHVGSVGIRQLAIWFLDTAMNGKTNKNGAELQTNVYNCVNTSARSAT